MNIVFFGRVDDDGIQLASYTYLIDKLMHRANKFFIFFIIQQMSSVDNDGSLIREFKSLVMIHTNRMFAGTAYYKYGGFYFSG